MKVYMSVRGEPDHHLLTSLEDWLHLEPDLRGAPVTRLPDAGPRAPDAPGDRLTIALPDDRAPQVLVGCLSTWLSTRIGDVRLSVTGPDGTVEVSVANIAEHEHLLRTALGDERPAGSPDG